MLFAVIPISEYMTENTKNSNSISGRYIVILNTKYIDKEDCPFFYYEVISYDGNIIELKREFGETWKIKKNKK